MSPLTRAAAAPKSPSSAAPDFPSAMGSLFVPSRAQKNVRFFARGRPEGVVHTTVANQPYAPVSNIAVVEAGPFIPALDCACGQANPDTCVRNLQGTMPYLDLALSREERKDLYESAPHVTLSPVQAYLAMRAAPINH